MIVCNALIKEEGKFLEFDKVIRNVHEKIDFLQSWLAEERQIKKEEIENFNLITEYESYARILAIEKHSSWNELQDLLLSRWVIDFCLNFHSP